MSTFTVDPDTLAKLQDYIATLCEDLTNMHKLSANYDGLIGGGPIEGEVTNFLNAWHTGIGMIEGDMQKVVRRLGEAAQSYENNDACVVAAAVGVVSTG
jgi:hypothetical protein